VRCPERQRSDPMDTEAGGQERAHPALPDRLRAILAFGPFRVNERREGLEPDAVPWQEQVSALPTAGTGASRRPALVSGSLSHSPTTSGHAPDRYSGRCWEAWVIPARLSIWAVDGDVRRTERLSR
jgi:hypothetical protein